ncbi:MAG: hypothetical protein EU541_01895 [Promethearchaeota archaeon]|nr:MAG: hypothetical protein EU541_01895 [Candidatus Lokiarchaeota archaeon]
MTQIETIIYLISLILTIFTFPILKIIAYAFLFSAGNSKEVDSRIQLGFLFKEIGILLILRYLIMIFYTATSLIIASSFFWGEVYTGSELPFATISLNIINSIIRISYFILIFISSILFLIIGIKNRRYFHLIITGSLYLSGVLIKHISSITLSILLDDGLLISIFNNLTYILNIIVGFIILMASISFLIFSLKYEEKFKMRKSRLKITGILLVLVGILELLYSIVYFNLIFTS